MRVLLLGDYSGFHFNLKLGLEKIGCDVTLFSSGDGWKNIPRDIDLGCGLDGLLGRLFDQFWLPDFSKAGKLEKFDVVQVINPVIFPFNFFHKIGSYWPNKKFLELVMGKADKTFLIGAGTDHFYVKECLANRYIYEPISESIEIDKGGFIKQLLRYNWMSDSMAHLNYWLLDHVSAVIPLCSEYRTAYEVNGVKNLADVIALPLDTSKIEVLPSVVGSGQFTHGRNKPGNKGSRHIMAAFELAKNIHPSYQFVVHEKMPLDQYMRSMRSTVCVVDQVNSFSYGMNALYSLASGKIVITGAEEECLLANKVPRVGFLLNARPDPQSILKSIDCAVDFSLKNPNYSDSCRDYVDTYHSCGKIAQAFINTWESW